MGAVIDHNFITPPGHHLNDCLADPTVSTGDDDDLPLRKLESFLNVGFIDDMRLRPSAAPTTRNLVITSTCFHLKMPAFIS